MTIAIAFQPELQRVVQRLIVERGELVLAMFYKDDASEPGWNLIVSGPWTDRLGRAEAIGVVVQTLSEELSPENKQIISRVTVLATKDPFVREITSVYQVASPGAELWVTNISAAGIPIGVGYIFRSRIK
jgi:hypothetical protein